jgi:hypothetical protein
MFDRLYIGMVVHGRYTSHESGKAFDLHYPILGHHWSSFRHTTSPSILFHI